MDYDMFWAWYWPICGVLFLCFCISKSHHVIVPYLERNQGKGGFAKWLASWYWPTHEFFVLSGIEEHYRKAGHPNPIYAAQQEVFIRGEYLERFRDLATDAYLSDGTDLEEMKKQFIKDNLSAKTTILDTATTANVRAIIRDMQHDEAYHPEAYTKWKADLEKWSREVLAEAERTFGPGGYTPLQRRVLRGRS